MSQRKVDVLCKLIFHPMGTTNSPVHQVSSSEDYHSKTSMEIYSVRALFSSLSKLICICFGFPLMLNNCLKTLTPLHHPIRNNTKTNRDLLKHVLSHFVSAACVSFEFSLNCINGVFSNDKHHMCFLMSHRMLTGQIKADSDNSIVNKV